MTSTRAPLRHTVISTRRPIASAIIRFCRAVLETTDSPSTATRMSPVRSPATSAGLPDMTCATRNPSRRSSLEASGGGKGAWLPAMPSQARRTRPAVISALMMLCVVALIGTARPTPMPATAVFTPTIRPGTVGQHAAAVARVEGGVGLDHFVHHPAASCRQGPPEGRDDAGRHAAGQSERVAQGDHELADPKPAGVAQPNRRGNRALRSQHGQVGEGISAHHVDIGLRPVREGCVGFLDALDDVGAGQQMAVLGQHTRTAGPLATPMPYAEAGHAGQHGFGHADDRVRVGVEGGPVDITHESILGCNTVITTGRRLGERLTVAGSTLPPMVVADDVRRIALGLPQVVEIDSDGFDFRVANRGFVWSYPERVPGNGWVIRTDIAVLYVGDEGEKQALLLGEPKIFFMVPEWDRHAVVLVRLAQIDESRLVELVTDAWRMRAPADVVEQLPP